MRKRCFTWLRKSSARRYSSNLQKKGEVILNTLTNFIKGIEVVDRQTCGNLSLCFLRNREKQDLQIRNYAQAIEDKTLLITEVDESGNIPELRFLNKGAQPVFVPEGSIIMGLKQSLTVRISIVINGHQEIAVPVLMYWETVVPVLETSDFLVAYST
jgi:hypothetical protein